jgi:DNA-binding transcriptional LysR family regulator
VVRPGHPLAGDAAVSVPAVLGYPLVVYSEGTIPRHTTESFLSAWGLKLPSPRRLDTLDVALARLVVRDTDAVWFTPIGAAADDLGRGTLARLDLHTQGTEEPVGLLLRSEPELTMHAREFLASLRGLAGRTR